MKRGSLDVLHGEETYGDGIPDVPSYDGPLPARFEAWPNRKRAGAGDGLHCFVDDTRLEPIWKNPGLSRRSYEGRVVVSPDFSLWSDWPKPLLDWNVYRTRWTARAMEARGALVIPSVSWCPGYRWSFRGIPWEGTVAISAYGAMASQRKATKYRCDVYREGFERMVDEVHPTRIVVIGGVMPAWLEADTRVHYFMSNTIGDLRGR